MSAEQRLEFYDRLLAAYADLLGVERGAERDGESVRLETPNATYVAGLAVSGVAARVDNRRVILIADGDATAPSDWTLFDTRGRHASGPADAASERLANELRRYGIRFYSRPDGGRCLSWEDEPPAFVLDASDRAERNES